VEESHTSEFRSLLSINEVFFLIHAVGEENTGHGLLFTEHPQGGNKSNLLTKITDGNNPRRLKFSLLFYAFVIYMSVNWTTGPVWHRA